MKAVIKIPGKETHNWMSSLANRVIFFEEKLISTLLKLSHKLETKR